MANRDDDIRQLIADLGVLRGDAYRETERRLLAIGKPATRFIIDALASQNTRVRQAVAGLLSYQRFRSPETVPALTKALSDESSGVRLSVVISLSRLEDERAIEPLLATLNDDDAIVRGCAASALAHLNYPPTFNLALKMLKEDSDVDARGGAAHALGWLRDPRSLEPLLEMLAMPHYEDRSNAATAFLFLRDKRVIPALRAALNDESRHVRKMAEIAISEIEREDDESDTE